MARPLDPAYRSARNFRVGDEILPAGESEWRRIIEIHDLPGRRRLILAPYHEFYVEPSFRVEHRRVPTEEV